VPRKRRGPTFCEELARLAASEQPLRGEAKLEAAVAAFPVEVHGRVALDAGASTGGFTRTLLRHGARRVYAVDAGHGQLLGSLRQDPRVVNLEATNLGALTRELVPERIELVTLDLSYVSLAEAVPQLDRIDVAGDLVALVKPTFELRLATPPEDPRPALDAAVAGIERAGWHVRGTVESPVRGAHGTVEYFVFATRLAGGGSARSSERCPDARPRGTT
jgi:23S rRNA (cytidine1920-2'-O)/16S rRNA (cytidine1409-2'-O)-methyltransferase